MIAERVMGISLSGGKNDKTWIALFEYYPKEKKLFLSHLFDKIKPELEVSSDTQLIKYVRDYSPALVTIDAPLAFPLCSTCRLKCPGFEACDEDHIRWMWSWIIKRRQKKSNVRLVTPYTERCADLFISQEFPDLNVPNPALGGSQAPLAARARFLKRQLEFKVKEVNFAASVFRMGVQLGLPEKRMKNMNHSFQGERLRGEFLRRLLEKKDSIFVYQQDAQKLKQYPHAFSSFICAYVGYLSLQNRTEKRPKSFPKSEIWPLFPEE